MARGDSYQLQGQQGGVVLDSGSSAADSAGPFRWLSVILDAEFDGMTSNLVSEGKLIGPTIPAGIGIGGKFSDVVLVSGLVIAYTE